MVGLADQNRDFVNHQDPLTDHEEATDAVSQ